MDRLEQGRPDVLRETQAIDDELVLAIQARDTARLVERVYAEDAVVLPTGQPMVWGTAEIAEYWHGMFRAGLRDISLEVVTVKAADNVALKAGRYILRIELDGADALLERGSYLAVHWRRSDGCWRLVASTFSEDGPSPWGSCGSQDSWGSRGSCVKG